MVFVFRKCTIEYKIVHGENEIQEYFRMLPTFSHPQNIIVSTDCYSWCFNCCLYAIFTLNHFEATCRVNMPNISNGRGIQKKALSVCNIPRHFSRYILFPHFTPIHPFSIQFHSMSNNIAILFLCISFAHSLIALVCAWLFTWKALFTPSYTIWFQPPNCIASESFWLCWKLRSFTIFK